MCCVGFFFFKQKTAYEMRISDWSSDVCSSDLGTLPAVRPGPVGLAGGGVDRARLQIAVLDLGNRQHLAVVAGGEHLVGLQHALPSEARLAPLDARSSEVRRGGKGWVSTCRSRWSPYNKKKNKNKILT